MHHSRAAMSQFSDDATWINSQGYYFEGKDNVRKFHATLAGSATRDSGRHLTETSPLERPDPVAP